MSVKFDTPLSVSDYEEVDKFSDLQAEKKDKFTEGTWDVTITSADIQETKNGKGTMVVLHMETDTCRQREFFLVSHTNPIAAGIGKRKLAQVARATGLSELTSPSELVGKDIVIELVENIATGYLNVDRVSPPVKIEAEPDSFGNDTEFEEEDVDL